MAASSGLLRTTSTAGSAVAKEGQPVPESNLAALLKSEAVQPAQEKVPARDSP
tara:strand:+ start:366 stop:524 length:159 start_codon:yes stop_codon:yes gene_type:complete